MHNGQISWHITLKDPSPFLYFLEKYFYSEGSRYMKHETLYSLPNLLISFYNKNNKG